MEIVDQNGEALAAKRDQARDSGFGIKETAERAKAIAAQGIDAMSTAAEQVRATAVQSSDSIKSYTRENPVSALLVAAASGAFFILLLSALRPSKR